MDPHREHGALARVRRPPGARVRSALRLRCPACGDGRPFASALRMRRTCPECGFRFEREYGYFTGAIYILYGTTAVLLTAVFYSVSEWVGAPLSAQWPWLLAVAVLFPLVFFRFARLLWIAMDLVFSPPGAGDFPSPDEAPHD